MSKYKDQEGNPIRIGDAVACAITINQDRFFHPYVVRICKKQGRKLVLDGALGVLALCDTEPEHLQVLHKDVDLRRLMGDWGTKYRDRGSLSSRLTSYEAHNFARDIFQALYINTYSTHSTKEALERIKSMKALGENEEFREKLTEFLTSVDTLRKAGDDAKKKGYELNP